MELREKVIKGFECCLPMTTKDGCADCKHCPYDRPITLEGGVCECIHELMMDALELVKTQEIVNAEPTSDGWWKCGACGSRDIVCEYFDESGINYVAYDFCPECGRRLKWNDK